MESVLVTLARYAPLVGLLAVAILLNLYLVNFYQAAPRATGSWTPGAWVARWAFAPADLGGFSYRQLALVSVLGLFLELLMIRWISSEIRIFAYFKNFVLIACFLGFGLGCYLCRRASNLVALVLPLLALVALVKLPWHELRTLIADLPAQLGPFSDVNVWGVPAVPLDAAALGRVAIGVLVIVPIFALIALVFIPIGQLVGWYLENAGQGIAGYSVNILGSLAGILLYTLLCFLYQPPAIWLALAGVMLGGVVWRRPVLRWTALAAFAVSAGLAAREDFEGGTVYWSPYQKLALTPRYEAGRVIGYILTTNGGWYQLIADLSPGFVATHPQLFARTPVAWNAYNVPYHFHPQPPAVLVLGSGMGNDVAAALRNGAGRVVAVEIDPLILALGRQFHLEHPYSSPRVEQVVDDARSYIQNSPERFDLIVFSLLDSHTTSSHFSNIRIDNYVYTVEALQAAQRLLKPDGIFIVKFQVEVPWIAGRLYGLLDTVFGRPPLQLQADQVYTATRRATGGMFFISGAPAALARALADPQLAAYVTAHGHVAMERAPPTTDDWPYFYQHAPGLPATVIVISLALVLVCGVLVGRTGAARRSIRWHFFFLGAGFLLLEAQIISKMALLFGTTWVVNAIVISGLLLLIVGANRLVQWRPDISVAAAYGGIGASLVVAWVVPLERFLFPSLALKVLAATAVLCLPVLFAGIVFIRSFAREGFRGEALGSNLVGALVGGLLESLSFWTGIRSLLVIAALLYAASWVALWAEQRRPPVAPHRAPGVGAGDGGAALSGAGRG